MPSGSFQLIPVLIGISILTFLMLYLVPGDPMQSFAGDKPLTEERAAVLRHQLGLDRPLWVQYLDYASHASAAISGASCATSARCSTASSKSSPARCG